MHGGGHERGMLGYITDSSNSGMGKAFKIGKEVLDSEMKRITVLRQRLIDGVADIEEVHLNGLKTVMSLV